MDIQEIKELYANKENLTEYFKTTQNKIELNSKEIELIYDLQSENYKRDLFSSFHPLFHS